MTSKKPAKSIRWGGKGFTIIELLTVMSIIIILLSVLVPALSRVRRYAKVVVQKGQFHEISKGLELFRNEHQETYPDSGATALSTATGTTVGYCGAMKLCEALLGQDGMGFHPSSKFTADGQIMVNSEPCDLYPFDLCQQTSSDDYTDSLRTNMRERVKYVDSENIKSYRLGDIFPADTWPVTLGTNYPAYGKVAFQASGNEYPYSYANAVIGDVFLRADIKYAACAGRKVGMPVLYYKADPSKLIHDPSFDITLAKYSTTNPSIYNFDDNYAITLLGCPWEASPPPDAGGTGPAHPMQTDLQVFYKAITNEKITSTPRPHNEDTYILISAGWDGLYGTRDDVFNFTD